MFRTRTRRRLWAALVTVVGLTVAGAVAFAGGAGEAPEPEEDAMVIGIPNEPNSLDPHRFTSRMARKVGYLVYDPLVVQDPETLEYLPALATSWEVSDDGLTWTFELRDDVVFHNGDPFTADDVKFTYERILDPATQATYALDDIGPLDRVEAVDDYTVRLHYREPYAPLLHYLALGQLQPMSRRAIEEQGADFGTAPYGAGTGPFEFVEWRSGQDITLRRNESYNWGPPIYENTGPPMIPRIEIRYIPDVEVSTVGMITGELDAVDFLPDRDVQTLYDDPDVVMNQVYLPGMGLYSAFNVTKPPFDDVAVRRAANHAIDKEAIIETVKVGNALVGHGPIPFFFHGFNENLEYYYPYDPDRANQILDEAGWEMGPDGVRVRDGERLSGLAIVRERDDYIATAQMVQEMFAEVGIEIELQILEWGTLLDAIFAGEHNYTFMGHGHGESDVVYTLFHSSNIGGFNLAHISDEYLDSLIEKQRVTPDLEERAEILREIQEIVMLEKALWVPIYNDIQYWPTNARIEGVKVHPNGWFLLNDARIAN